MWWFVGSLSLVLSLVCAWYLRRLHPRSTTHASGKRTAQRLDRSEWEQLSRDVQRHMHNLCVYRDAIKHSLLDESSRDEHPKLNQWFERLVCEIADHMTLIKRAHRLLHEQDKNRKETDPDIIKQALRRRCRDSAQLCEEITSALDMQEIKRRRSTTGRFERSATASEPADQASQQNQTSN